MQCSVPYEVVGKLFIFPPRPGITPRGPNVLMFDRPKTISLRIDNTGDIETSSLWLEAECRKRDGSYQRSRLDLQDCVSFGPDGSLRGNTEAVTPNWRLVGNNRVKDIQLIQAYLGLAATCQGTTSDFGLGSEVRNNNGILEFVCSIP